MLSKIKKKENKAWAFHLCLYDCIFWKQSISTNKWMQLFKKKHLFIFNNHKSRTYCGNTGSEAGIHHRWYSSPLHLFFWEVGGELRNWRKDKWTRGESMQTVTRTPFSTSFFKMWYWFRIMALFHWRIK